MLDQSSNTPPWNYITNDVWRRNDDTRSASDWLTDGKFKIFQKRKLEKQYEAGEKKYEQRGCLSIRVTNMRVTTFQSSKNRMVFF